MKKFKVILISLSKEDLQSGKNYYKDINPNLALPFLARIREAKIFISENPLANDIAYRNVRSHLIKQFPYQIHYIINEIDFEVIIIAIEFAKREDLDFFDRV